LKFSLQPYDQQVDSMTFIPSFFAYYQLADGMKNVFLKIKNAN